MVEKNHVFFFFFFFFFLLLLFFSSFFLLSFLLSLFFFCLVLSWNSWTHCNGETCLRVRPFNRGTGSHIPTSGNRTCWRGLWEQMQVNGLVRQWKQRTMENREANEDVDWKEELRAKLQDRRRSNLFQWDRAHHGQYLWSPLSVITRMGGGEVGGGRGLTTLH